ncbi:hypothetical protein [Pedobacter sandarakinus]|uniref:hypothetical protein n=1 Tax=Pedobacter sandarakinus TaxID=353156 RepID=UPI0022469D46|nr:hypothetical protein [Pedobacter sandarakinus]MCX2575564.1 hypothetical protein [Pedobacter sandarakinus]
MQASITFPRYQEIEPSLRVALAEEDSFFARLKAKDCEAFKIIYQEYAPALFGNILRKVDNKDQACVILEQTYIDAWNAVSNYDGTKLRIFTWLNQLANKRMKTASTQGIA